MPDAEIEQLISIFGERRRKLLESCVPWLREHEPTWNLDTAIDKETWIREILEREVSDE